MRFILHSASTAQCKICFIMHSPAQCVQVLHRLKYVFHTAQCETGHALMLFIEARAVF